MKEKDILRDENTNFSAALEEKKEIEKQLEQRNNEIEEQRKTQFQMENENSLLGQQLQDEKANRDKAILECEEEIIKLRNQVQQLCQENSAKKAESEEQKVNNIVLGAEIGRLRRDIKIEQDRLRECQEEKGNLSNQTDQLSQENARKDTQIQQLQSEIQHLQSHIFAPTKTVEISHNILGTGGWGEVRTGHFNETKVAVKKYFEIILSPYNQKNVNREIHIASECRHPNLLQFICASTNEKGHLLIVTELMDMSLRNLLEQRAQERLFLERHEVEKISVDVALGCWYLHSKKPNAIIHRDISSANVLLQIEDDRVVRAKISDYGSANFKQRCKTANPGAPLYAAPEASQANQDPKVI